MNTTKYCLTLVYFSFSFLSLGCENDCLNRLQELLSINTTVSIDSEIGCIEWDQLLIVAPYALPDKIEERTGIDLNIRTNKDSYFNLVFIKKSSSVESIKVQRTTVDFLPMFSEEESSDGYILLDRNHSNFELYDTDEKFSNGKTVRGIRRID